MGLPLSPAHKPSVGELYRIELALFPQGSLRRLPLEIVPLFERAPSG
jgi:hypothetical protein